MNRIGRLPRGLSTLMASLLVGVLVENWILVLGLVRSLTDPLNPIWSPAVVTYVSVVGGFLGLLVAAVVGFLRRRVWGACCAYLLVPVSTVLHGIPLVPYVTARLPTLELRIAAVVVVNLAFLTATTILHVQHRKRIAPDECTT